jgi:hypothetical protein
MTSPPSANANHSPSRPGSSSSGQIACGSAGMVRVAVTSITVGILSVHERFSN